MTLGDEEARRRRSQKSVLERKAPPTFDVVVEIQSRDRVTVHADVADTVDAMLRGDPIAPELRYRDEPGGRAALTGTAAAGAAGPDARRALRRPRRHGRWRLARRAGLAARRRATSPTTFANDSGCSSRNAATGPATGQARAVDGAAAERPGRQAPADGGAVGG